jgi:ClpP class serine protease
MRDTQYAILQGMIDDFYAGFRGLVATARPGLDPSKMDALTDGRVFTGRQALEEGLVDELGGLREAFARAKQLAGVSRARLVKYHEDGRVPSSAYASALAPAASGGGAQVNLLQVNGLGLGGVGDASTGGAGFYYLWTSPLAN